MPGWTTGDNFHNNIAYTPGTWIALHRICEKHGVGDQFRIHYDPSHAILMGQDTRSIFQYLKDAGYNFLIGGFHVKGQVIDAKGVSAWGYGGQTVERGDWIDGKPSANPADQLNAWKKQTVLCEHELPGTARHDPLAYLQNRTRGLARSPARGARAAAARRRQHAPRRRARVPEGAHPGRGPSRSRSCRARSRSCAGSTRPPPACTRCSTRCWRRRASPCRASAGSRIDPEPHARHFSPGQEPLTMIDPLLRSRLAFGIRSIRGLRRAAFGAAGVLMLLAGSQAFTAPQAPDAAARPLKVLFLGDEEGTRQSSGLFAALAPGLARRGIQLTPRVEPRRGAVHAGARGLRRAAHLRRSCRDHAGPGTGAGELRGRGQGGRRGQRGHRHVPVVECLRRAARRARRAQGLRRVLGDHRRHPQPGAAGAAAVHHHRRHLHLHEAEPGRSHRADGARGRQGREPYTWVRTHGKGRVFYTAFGHDERTWSNPGFQQLVEQATCTGP